ncbi:serine protease [Photobacterium sp. TY1-4]|uniref:serine protease n=1 Tax=Photobacterium sp. TY1-4 TaxID=2899122 RepID=UPI0021C03208|nr:serine protease [Photobacterium sp. TY1-4]UXI00949.1 serine protease [Photobacterium sp. TY1-4]
MTLLVHLKRFHRPSRTGLCLSVCMLASCVTSNGPVSPANPHQANQMVVVGIPLLLGGFGSAVPVNDQYMITAKHVARLSWDFEVIHHPFCDLSLIRRRADFIPTWGLIYPDQPVSHHGHSLLGNTIKGKGKYLQDVIDTNTDCLYSLSDAPVMSGMSGGPVFNQYGDIVGITVAIVNNPEDLRNLRPARRYSQFVPATLIFDWLDALGIATTAATSELAAIQVSPYVRRLNRPGVTPTELAQTKQPQTEQSRIDGLTPAVSDSAAALRSPAPVHHEPLATPQTGSRIPVAPAYLPPGQHSVPASNAEALSGLRPQPEDDTQLAAKPSGTPASPPFKRRYLFGGSEYNADQ